MILMGEVGYKAAVIETGHHIGETFYIDAEDTPPTISNGVFIDCTFYIVDTASTTDSTFTNCEFFYDKEASLISNMCLFLGGSMKYIDWEEFID